MVDFLIVGQGIAGSVLALQLLKHNQRILVINNRKRNIASNIAAGICNPITGRGMVRTWLAEALFPYLNTFYREASQILGTQFWHPIPIFRPFLTYQERTEWLQKANQDYYAPFVKSVVGKTFHQEHIVRSYGGIVLNQSGYLDVQKFLKATRHYLSTRNAYTEADFFYDHVRFGEYIQYQNIAARQIIFCEGPQAEHNPFFCALPFRLVKGELIRISGHQPLEVIYNRHIFVLPKAAHETVVGATYDWQDVSLAPTAKAREILEKKLCSTFNLSYNIYDQQAGIRPATFDRRPFIGVHPQFPQLAIFNGLGTKGVSLAPYFTKIFVEHLLLQRTLPRAVQLDRVGFGKSV
ncbi:MAG: NAD(P)/FAD-dependent oxidoreductase [Bacteroidota bacterium]